ncbi:MAG TPA: ATP-binding cassette domain-containing protein [Saprospiraceae bacterium]|nr:ATP-binding cassette domain-containing protein [Saprospiraceae bacterium]HPN68953.1 ATP-binding cassette domain-containing protein [Saprospiraceae bacterium]
MPENLVTLSQVSIQTKKGSLLSNIQLQISSGDRLNLLGPSSSGKSLLTKLIAGYLSPTGGQIHYDVPLEKITLSGDNQLPGTDRLSYYEKRYEVFIQDDNKTVKDHLFQSPYFDCVQTLLQRFSLSHLLEKQKYQLSNGEHKLLSIITSVASEPQFLILDQPYLGVDAFNRTKLSDLIQSLPSEMALLLVGKIPDTELSNTFQKIHLNAGKLVENLEEPAFDPQQEQNKLTLNPFNQHKADYQHLVKMEGVSITYGDVPILKNIHFALAPGQRCVIKGPNGSGKSMLISLITGDNPKAYGQNIILFDRLRGSGESIWDIKNKIGYLSPELHQHFFRGESHVQKILFGKVQVLEDRFVSKMTCQDVVASGFTEGIGATSTVKEGQWLADLFAFFQMSSFKNEAFASLSQGKQRLVLLMRALVKQPPLLILDEPCQGLDDEQTLQFKNAINDFCRHTTTAVIYVSHMEEDIPACMNREIRIQGGEIIQDFIRPL